MAMLLLDTALALFAAGWSVDQVRADLRSWTNADGEPATCSYVEEVITAAIKYGAGEPEPPDYPEPDGPTEREEC